MRTLKITTLFIGIGGLNFILSIIYLSLSDLPGGEVGMAPFAIVILSLFTILISTIIYWVMRIWVDNVTPVRLVIVYHVVYFFLLSFNLENPTNGGPTAINEFVFWSYLLPFLVGLVLIVVLRRRERQKG